MVVLLSVQIASKLLVIDYNTSDNVHNNFIALVFISSSVYFNATLLLLTVIQINYRNSVNHDHAMVCYFQLNKWTLVKGNVLIVHFCISEVQTQYAIFTHVTH